MLLNDVVNSFDSCLAFLCSSPHAASFECCPSTMRCQDQGQTRGRAGYAGTAREQDSVKHTELEGGQ